MPRPSKKNPPERTPLISTEYVTAKQIAKINQLRIRQDELIADKYRPLSTAICMALPTLGAWSLLGPKKPLEGLWEMLWKYDAQTISASGIALFEEGLKNKTEAHQYFLAIARSLPSREALKEFKNFDANDPFNLFELQAHILEDKSMIGIIPDETRHNIKMAFISVFIKLAAFSYSPEINKYLSIENLQISAVGAFTATRKGNVKALEKKTPLEMVKLIRLAFEEMMSISELDPANRKYVDELLTIRASIAGLVSANYKMMLCFIVLAAAARNLIELAVNASYHALKKTDRDPIQIFLSFADAEEKIATLTSENIRLEKAATRNMYVMAFLMLTAFGISLSSLSEQKKESAALYVFILSNLTGMLFNFCKWAIKEAEQYHFENKIKQNTEQLNKSVAHTHTQWEYVNGGSKASSYFQFNGKQIGEHRDRVVSEVVKNTLAKKGVHIIAFEKDCVMISPITLSDAEAKNINEEIMAQLNRLEKIKKLTQQIHRYVSHGSHKTLVKHVILDKDRLPIATYQITLTSGIDLKEAKRIFSNCEIKQVDSKLYVTGYAPSDHFDLSLSRPLAKQDPTTRDVFFAPDRNLQKKKQIKKIEPAAEEKVVDEKSSDPVERIVFPSGVYDSSDPHCEIKKVNGLLNGKQYFVLFKLPENCFPSPETHRSAKNKVEEAEIAPCAKGARGLQIRPTWVKNRVDKKAGMFFSTLRYKYFGAHGKGKMRSYASVEENAEGNCLGVFVGLDKKHKLRSVS